MATVVVFGAGGGFLGWRLVDRLTAEGMTVRVAVRHPDPARIELRLTAWFLFETAALRGGLRRGPSGWRARAVSRCRHHSFWTFSLFAPSTCCGGIDDLKVMGDRGRLGDHCRCRAVFLD